MLVSAGESLIDFIQRPAPGRNPIYEAAPGGSPFNVALAMGTLGAPAGFLCPFSSDSLGRLLAGRLEEAGASLLVGAPTDKPTSLAIVSLAADGQASYQFYRKETADGDGSAETRDAALPPDLTLLHTGSLALATRRDQEIWGSLAHRVADRGIPLSIDPNIRPRFVDDWQRLAAELARLFERAAIVKTSDEDLGHLGIEPDPAALRALFIERHGVGLFAMTRGAEGAVLMSAEAIVEVPVFRPPVFVDTVGAGDTFMAALLASLHERGTLRRDALRGTGQETLAEVGRFAAIAAGLNCGEQGCNPPSRERVMEVLGGAA